MIQFFGKTPLIPIFLLAGLLLFVSGCAPQSIDPHLFPITPIDLETSSLPLTPEDQSIQPQLFLHLVTEKDPSLTSSEEWLILDAIREAVEAFGNIEVFTQEQVKDLLSLDKNLRFQKGNAADTISLAKSVNADFVSQIKIEIIKSPVEPGTNLFTAKITLTVFNVSSGQMDTRQVLTLDRGEPGLFEDQVKKWMQTRFPLRGFVLETRGEKEVARISLGRSFGIEIGRKFVIWSSQSSSEFASGFSKESTRFDSSPITEVRVIQVNESDCWVWISLKDRRNIKRGQTALAKPE